MCVGVDSTGVSVHVVSEHVTTGVGFVLFWVAVNVVLKQCCICVSETWVMKFGTCLFNDVNLVRNVVNTINIFLIL
jgi:hypothetical protein